MMSEAGNTSLQYENKTGFFRNLKVRFILLMCVVVLPVNILAVVISEVVLNSYEEKITTSYENQLHLYAGSIENEFEEMQDKVMNFLSEENLFILTMGGSSDSTVELTRLKKTIESGTAWLAMPGICYIWDHEKEMLSLFYQKKTYTEKQMQQIREHLEQLNRTHGIWTDSGSFCVGEMSFLTQEYHFPKFSFGILYDGESVLQKFFEDSREAVGNLYLADESEKNVSGLIAGRFEAEADKDILSEREASGQYLILRKDIGFGDCQIIWTIARKDMFAELPLLIRLLRILAVLSFAALPLLGIVATRLVIKPLWELSGAMKVVEEGDLLCRLDVETGTFQMDYILHTFNHMVERIHFLITESYEKEIERLQTDVINMQLQVNQHMLLNFLNTIYSLLSAGKAKQAGEFTLLLMKYFRYVLRKDIDLVPVKEEMRFVEDYLQLQKIRFPDSFTSAYAVSEDAGEVLIPQLLIENFVENTIKYGLIMGSAIEILINIRVEKERLYISVCDTGNGMSAEMARQLSRGEIIEDCAGKHIGIWNCRRRLKIYYGDAYELRITSREGEGTQIWVELPIEPLNLEDAVKYTAVKEG